MACKYCASGDLQIFVGELTLALPGIERVNLPPVYICADSSVCLDCGHTELVIPAHKLQQLRKGIGRLPFTVCVRPSRR
jgi:hypothetical protein